MEIVKISASKKYDVVIGADLLKDAGKMIAGVIPNGKAVIVSDDNVFPLYGEKLKESLEKEGFETETFVFKHGENSKNIHTYGDLLEFMCAKNVTRSDFVAALGGGVVGDLAGFAAATYQRGIRFVQLPTSLLAAVDSSVGGKTAIDLTSGKNQVGCFYQPEIVICDTDLLNTLPEAEYRNGCAEIIKYAFIGSKKLYEDLMERPVSEQYEKIISKCVEMKGEFVEKDEFDLGYRMFLNFGHTAGHAIENCSSYEIPHGQAVAMGMDIITKAAYNKGICPEETVKDMRKILDKYNLTKETVYSSEEMAQAALVDKKSKGSTLTLVLPEETGKCCLKKIQKTEFEDWLKSGGIK